MTTIPKRERDAATAELNKVKGWLGQQDFLQIAKQLPDYTASTVRAVAKGERFNLDIYSALLTLGRAKMAAFRSQLAADHGTASKAGRSAIEPTSSAKTAENAPIENEIPFPKTAAKKPRTPKPKVMATDDPEKTAVLNELASHGTVTVLPDKPKRPSRRPDKVAAKA